MIELTGVTKSFHGKLVLDTVSLTLPQGQTHVLLGSSGSGKSTLLKIILGLTSPDKGLIKVGDLVVVPKTQRKLASKMGYVIQEGGLYPHMTALENVILVARLKGWSASQIKNRVEELSELVSFDQSVLDQYPRYLSGGQKQRVGLIRALMLDPPFLILDEPLAALDPLVRFDLQNQLKEIFGKLQKTVVLVTHDIGEAAFFGDTVTLLNKGHVLQSGPFKELVTNPADPFVTRFINAQRPPPELQNV